MHTHFEILLQNTEGWKNVNYIQLISVRANSTCPPDSLLCACIHLKHKEIIRGDFDSKTELQKYLFFSDSVQPNLINTVLRSILLWGWGRQKLCVFCFYCFDFLGESSTRNYISTPKCLYTLIEIEIINVVLLTALFKQTTSCFLVFMSGFYGFRATISIDFAFPIWNLRMVACIERRPQSLSQKSVLGDFPFIHPFLFGLVFGGGKLFMNLEKNGARWPGYVRGRWNRMREQIHFPNR